MKYKDKVFIIDGLVFEVRKGLKENAYIIVLKPSGLIFLDTVKCYMAINNEVSSIAALKPDQKVTILGKSLGRYGSELIFGHCTLIQPGKLGVR